MSDYDWRAAGMRWLKDWPTKQSPQDDRAIGATLREMADHLLRVADRVDPPKRARKTRRYQ